MYIMYMYVCTVYTPPIWKNGYAEYRSLKPNSIQFNSNSSAVFPTLLNLGSSNLASPFLCPCRKQRTNKMHFENCADIDGFLKLGHKL